MEKYSIFGQRKQMHDKVRHAGRLHSLTKDIALTLLIQHWCIGCIGEQDLDLHTERSDFFRQRL